MNLLDLAPVGMVGWQEELDDAPALLLNGPGEFRVRLLITPKGITVVAAAADLNLVRDLLVSAGLPPERVRMLLCG